MDNTASSCQWLLTVTRKENFSYDFTIQNSWVLLLLSRITDNQTKTWLVFKYSYNIINTKKILENANYKMYKKY